MRIRSIKPEFWRSEEMAAYPIEDRLLFLGLWSYVDDNGVGRDSVASITADLFAYDLEIDPRETFARVQRGLANLAAGRHITRYVGSDGKKLIHIVNWHHQKIDRPSKPRYPLPTRDDAVTRETVASDSRDTIEGSLRARKDQGSREQGTEDQGNEGAAAALPPRADVEELCTLLADLIESNGSKRPTITDGWRTACRLLIDRDERSPDNIRAAIEWSQADAFWRSNILSMSKLREKYDQLRLQATRAAANGKPRRQAETNHQFDRMLARAAEREQTQQPKAITS